MSKEKIKVIGFGIGTSCKDYLSRYRDDYNIIALSDWDEATHNTERYGLKIIDPYKFNEFDYDKILILSVYTKEIKAQLKERLGIMENKIIAPPKYKVKGTLLPFEDPDTLSFARELLVYFSNLTKENNIRIFADYGTLLGIVRNEDLIPWDDDIDFSLTEEDAYKLEQLLIDNREHFPRNDEVQFNAWIRRDKTGFPWYISLHFDNKKDSSYREFEIAFGVRGVIDNMSFCMRINNIACDPIHFEQDEWLDWRGEKIRVPYQHLKYLDLVYGNWKQPEEYNFGTVYGSIYKGDIKDINVEMVKAPLF